MATQDETESPRAEEAAGTRQANAVPERKVPVEPERSAPAERVPAGKAPAESIPPQKAEQSAGVPAASAEPAAAVSEPSRGPVPERERSVSAPAEKSLEKPVERPVEKGGTPPAPEARDEPVAAADTPAEAKTGEGKPAEERNGRQDRAREKPPGDRPDRRPERPRPQGAKGLLLGEVQERAYQADSLLRTHLTGTTGLLFTNSGEQYVLDWTSEKPEVRQGAAENPDCVIRMSEQNLLKIASGDLNPQIGMLSDKIKVEGKLSFAVYFFNLVVPRGAAERG